jgi:hypothetical protein
VSSGTRLTAGPDDLTAEAARATTERHEGLHWRLWPRWVGRMPRASPARRGRSGDWVWLITAVVAAACFLLRWRGSPGADDVIWAEDGSEFLQAELTHPTASNLLRPYAGYAHLVPRVVAALVSEMPLSMWATAMAVASVAIRVAAAVVAYQATKAYIADTRLRLALAAVFVTLPVGGLETLNNIANIHWFMIPAAALILLWRPRSWIVSIAGALWIIATVMSDPLTVLLAPLVLWRLLAVRDWREHAPTAAFFLGSVVQGLVVLGAPPRAGGDASPVEVLEGFGLRVLTGWLFGVELSFTLVIMVGLAGAIAVGSFVTATVIAPAIRNAGPRRQLAFAMLAESALFFIVAGLFTASGVFIPESGLPQLAAAARYSVVGILLLAPAIVAGLDAWLDSRKSASLGRVGLAAVASIYLIGVAQTYGSDVISSSAPPWRDVPAVIEKACADGVPEAVVPIAPDTWAIRIPCGAVK